MLHYFYHLEYPEVHVQEKTGAESQPATHAKPQTPAGVKAPETPAKVKVSEKSEEPAIQSSAKKNGGAPLQPSAANGQPPSPQQQRVMEYSIEREQFIDPTSPTAATGETSSETGAKSKKKKKKGRMNSQVEPLEPTTLTNGNNHATPTAAQAQPEPQTTSPKPIVSNSTAATAAAATSAKPTTTHPSLTVDAKLYTLATKYGVSGLAAQAAGRFEHGVATHWGTADFLRAAREAYTTTAREDRRLREAVLAAFQAHPELLTRHQVQEAIRGLELSFDLLMAKTQQVAVRE